MSTAPDPESVPPSERDGGRVILVAAAAVVVASGLFLARPFLTPLLLAAFIAALTAPLVIALRDRGAPVALAVSAGILLDFVVLGAISLILGIAISQLTDEQDHYAERATELYASLIHWLEANGYHGDEASITEFAEPQQLIGAAGDLLRRLASIVSQLFVVLLLVAFMLHELTTSPGKVQRVLHEREDLRAVNAALSDVKAFMQVKAGTSAATGVLAGALCAAAGVDLAVLWGLTAFLFNFIPTVGSIIAAVPPVVLATIMIGPGTGLAILGGFLVINMIIGNVLEPRMMGRALGLSPLAVLISLLAWAFVLGPVGALLSPALTVFMTAWFEHTRDLGWVAVLLRPGKGSQTGESS